MGEVKERKDDLKGISHIHVVWFIQHTFWPSCGLKETGVTWLGDIKQVTWTFIDECSRNIERWCDGRVQRKGDWSEIKS